MEHTIENRFFNKRQPNIFAEKESPSNLQFVN